VSADLSGKIALVTGASRGIGRAVALALAGKGADVALAARHPEPAEAVAEEIRALDRKALVLGLDVSDLAAVEGAAGRIGEELGKVSILVNNAGITRDQLLLRMKPEEWSEVLRVNLDGTFHCTKVFCRDMMKARWGRIINISSVVGVLGNAGQANYAASKAGILGFTRSVARELAGRGVTANAVAPGYIVTAMTENLPESAREALQQSIPMGRLGSPEDVAGTVAFLAGKEAAYITGQVIHVDGGMVMA
jgi:3-oxoacyl-[acyl-carrier protein] reductase